VATTPAVAEIVRPVANQGIGQGIENQCDEDSQADRPRHQTDYRSVEQQQEIIETVVLDAESRRPEPMASLSATDGFSLTGGLAPPPCIAMSLSRRRS
jgi:hypothetical protein